MVQSQAESFTISQLAASADVGVETVRFYQRKGLMNTPKRHQGIRRYNGKDLDQLRFIRIAKQAGFTLHEIQELLDLDASHDHQRARELANARITELDTKIKQMQQAREMLTALAHQCADNPQQPCAILKAFRS